MSTIKTEFPLQFSDHEEHISLDELNGAYGEQGLTYRSLGEAKAALAAMGFMPTRTPLLWKKGTQCAYLTPLREAQLETTSHYQHATLKRTIEVCRTTGYNPIGALITFAGNVPYWKV